MSTPSLNLTPTAVTERPSPDHQHDPGGLSAEDEFPGSLAWSDLDLPGFTADGPAEPDVPSPPTSDIRPLVPIHRAAQILGRTPRTLRRWVQAGHLTAVRIGCGVFLLADEINALIDRQISERIYRHQGNKGSRLTPSE